MERALQRYLRHHHAIGSTSKTLTYHRDSIGLLIRFLRERGHSCELDDLTLDDVHAWVTYQRQKGLAQKTIRTRLVSVRAWTRWLVEEEWLDKNPLRQLKLPKVDDTPKERLSSEEVDKLLKAAKKGRGANAARDTAILLLLYSTGVRATELLNLQLADIDWDKGLILIRRGKGGKFQTVPLGGKAEKALDKYLHHPKRKVGATVFVTETGQPLSYDGL
jgi:site-specific recombinase XerD